MQLAAHAWPWPCSALEGGEPEPFLNMLAWVVSGVCGAVRGLVTLVTAGPACAGYLRHSTWLSARPSIPQSAPVPSRGLADAPCAVCLMTAGDAATVRCPNGLVPTGVPTRARRAPRLDLDMDMDLDLTG